MKRKKRADGRYSEYVFMGYHADGTENRKYVFAYSEPELERKLFELKMTIAKGEFIKKNDVTLKEWAEIWLKTYKAGKEYKTIEMYESVVNGHIIKEIGHLRLLDIKPFHLQGLINSRHKQGLTRTLEIIRLTLKQIFDQAIENELLIKNPARRLEIPKSMKIEKIPLSDEEMDAINQTDLSLKSQAFILLCAYAGLRRGEALALTQNDIKGGYIFVNKTLVFKKNKSEIKSHPKSSAGARKIPIADDLKTTLDLYLQEVKGIYIFRSENSPLMTKSAFRRMWESSMDKINKGLGGTDKIKIFRHVTPHILRHTFATMLYYAGVDIKTAQYLLGHASSKITLDLYTHLKESENTAVHKINKFLVTVSKRCQNENSESPQDYSPNGLQVLRMPDS